METAKLNKKMFLMTMLIMWLYDCVYVNIMYNEEERYFYSAFPPTFYQSVLSEPVLPSHRCNSVGTCRYAESDKFSMPICYCDLACIEYNDCCYDAPLTDTVTSVNSLDDKKEYKSCENRLFYEKYFGAWMVSKCPLSFTMSDISNRCNMEENKHPVSADDGTVYRNLHCAFCHNVTKVSSWRFEFKVQGKCTVERLKALNTTIPDKIKHALDNCDYDFIPPSSNSKLRYCFNFTTKSDFLRDNVLCSKFQNPLNVGDKVFKNIHCLGELKNKTVLCIRPIARHSKLRSIPETSGIFNIVPVFDNFGSKECHNDKFYYDITEKIDPRMDFPRVKEPQENQDTCLPNTCMEKNTEGCDADLMLNFMWRKRLSFVTDAVIDKYFVLRLAAFIYVSLPKDSYNITLHGVKIMYMCGANITDDHKPCCTADAEIEFRNLAPMTEDNILRIEAEVSNLTWQYKEIHNQSMVTAVDVLENRNITYTCVVTKIKRQYYIKGIKVDTSSFKMEINRRPSMTPKHIKGIVVVLNGSNEDAHGSENDKTTMLRHGSQTVPRMRFEHIELQYNETSDKMTNDKPGPSLSSAGTTLSYLTYTHVVSLLVQIAFIFLIS